MPIVTLKAKNVIDLGHGFVQLEIPATLLSREEQQTLECLFPDFGEAVSRLLVKQALIDALAKESDFPDRDDPPEAVYPKTK